MGINSEVLQITESSGSYPSASDGADVRSGYKRTELGIIPEDWRLLPVRRMGDVLTGKALAVNAPGRQRPYLRTKNVFDGRIAVGDILTMPMTDAQFQQFKIIPGDVLLNEGQSLELVGRCAMYRGEYPEPCAMQNQLLRFRARAGVSAEFCSHLFRYCQQTGVFTRIALQTTSIAHLGGTRFELLVTNRLGQRKSKNNAPSAKLCRMWISSSKRWTGSSQKSVQSNWPPCSSCSLARHA